MNRDANFLFRIFLTECFARMAKIASAWPSVTAFWTYTDAQNEGSWMGYLTISSLRVPRMC